MMKGKESESSKTRRNWMQDKDDKKSSLSSRKVWRHLQHWWMMGWDIDRPKPEVSADAPPDLNVYLQVET